MSIADTKARIHEALVAGFAQRGFTYCRLPRKSPNYNRCLPFIKAVGLPGPAPSPPTATWQVDVDLQGVRAGQHGYVLLDADCTVRIDAIAELIGDEPPMTFSFSPGRVTRSAAQILQINDGDDPAPSIAVFFDVVDTIALPRFRKYSIIENMVAALTPPPPGEEAPWPAPPLPPPPPPHVPCRYELLGGDPSYPWEFMAAIAGACLIGKLDLCETIATRGRATYANAIDGSVQASLGADFASRLAVFYTRHLKARGAKPDGYL